VFAVCGSDGCFLGASPERLCGVRGDQVFIDCLAGTRRRGQTPPEDELLAEQLMNSLKDRAEHEVVRRWIVNTVADITTDLAAPEVPRIKRLHNVQHLHTPITGRLRPGVGVLDVAERLHPTPAVAGVPRAAALEWIGRTESFDRGWYAGALGWIEPPGDGEFAVALRSALIRGDEAVLFAGAGIMGDSDPRDEWEETGWKLHPMLSVLRLTELEASRR
jgi:isochorismate synthase